MDMDHIELFPINNKPMINYEVERLMIKISDNQWKSSLNEGKIKELKFHNRDRNKNIVKDAIKNDTYENFYYNPRNG